MYVVFHHQISPLPPARAHPEAPPHMFVRTGTRARKGVVPHLPRASMHASLPEAARPARGASRVTQYHTCCALTCALVADKCMCVRTSGEALRAASHLHAAQHARQCRVHGRVRFRVQRLHHSQLVGGPQPKALRRHRRAALPGPLVCAHAWRAGWRPFRLVHAAVRGAGVRYPWYGRAAPAAWEHSPRKQRVDLA